MVSPTDICSPQLVTQLFHNTFCVKKRDKGPRLAGFWGCMEIFKGIFQRTAFLTHCSDQSGGLCSHCVRGKSTGQAQKVIFALEYSPGLWEMSSDRSWDGFFIHSIIFSSSQWYFNLEISAKPHALLSIKVSAAWASLNNYCYLFQGL